MTSKINELRSSSRSVSEMTDSQKEKLRELGVKLNTKIHEIERQTKELMKKVNFTKIY